MPQGLQESEKLSTPMFTPSTKAEQGEHDENIHPDQRNSLTVLKSLASKTTHWRRESSKS